MIDLAADYNIIDKKGAWFSYKGQRLGQGRDMVREELKKNPKLFEELEGLVAAGANRTCAGGAGECRGGG